jgi:small conductance mechanosensitive channel
MDVSQIHNLSELWLSYAPVLINIALVIIVAWVVSRIVHLAGRRLSRRLQAQTPTIDTAGRTARLLTLSTLIEHVVQTLIIVLAIVTILGAFGVNLAPIITGLGVAGLAVSLGAQTLIKDYVGGIMILIENQFVVGEQVTIGAVSGTVEHLTLRLTTLRDSNGSLHLVPNGDVRVLTNSSRKKSI